MPKNSDGRQELARFLRSRRERISPDQVGLPAGPRRRSGGLRREEVAVLAGLSPTWYAYLEQARDIHPSPEVLDSLARVLQLSEDERRYVHTLTYGQIRWPGPLDAELTSEELVREAVAGMESADYPVYAANEYADLVAWNQAATEWYEDWGRLPEHERNIVRWMVCSPIAKQRLRNWESDTLDIIARWRHMSAGLLEDPELRQRVEAMHAASPMFGHWWERHDVQEHRTKVRKFAHPRFGEIDLRLLIVESPEFTPSFIVLHLPIPR